MSSEDKTTSYATSSTPIYSFEVTHGKNVFTVDLSGDTTLKQLKEEIQKKTQVPIGLQKLLFRTKEKPNLKDDGTMIKDLGLIHAPKFKILLMGSTLEQIIEASSSKPKRATSSSQSNEPSSPVTLKISQLPEHKKYIDKGVPEHAEKGDKTKDLAVTQPINGILNNRGEEIRFTFKQDLRELWIQSKSSTEKIPYAAIRYIDTEPIHSNADYHIMGFQIGQSTNNKLWFYYVPAQYVRWIKYTVSGLNDFPFFN
ncbi:hypothetical protein FDP41_010045 [Naegleria fowleri]|uniref:Ubiquitin-like domain-containing protein n=1 Tax=Naegleria fowleri TaxID=5763 RepID=A0A6A5B9I2_NAEFO|nr:uncharacterized protein FDP41_010045 [Naegleria fowleri]KAF0971822.1 hypothetical protein FDP41_010045 [Naegleria fowleri]